MSTNLENTARTTTNTSDTLFVVACGHFFKLCDPDRNKLYNPTVTNEDKDAADKVENPLETLEGMCRLLGLTFDGTQVTGSLPLCDQDRKTSDATFMVRKCLALVENILDKEFAKTAQALETKFKVMVHSVLEKPDRDFTTEDVVGVAGGLLYRVLEWKADPTKALIFSKKMIDLHYEATLATGQIHRTNQVLDSLLIREAIKVLRSRFCDLKAILMRY